MENQTAQAMIILADAICDLASAIREYNASIDGDFDEAGPVDMSGLPIPNRSHR